MNEKESFEKSKKVIEKFCTKLFTIFSIVGLTIASFFVFLFLQTEPKGNFILYSGILFILILLMTFITFSIFVGPIARINHTKDYRIYIDGLEKYKE